MYCQNCGTKNADDSIFCYECGTKLDKSAFEQNEHSKSSAEQPRTYKENKRTVPKREEKTDKQINKTVISIPKKKIPKIALVIVAEAVILICLVCGFSSAHKNTNTPEKLAENFFVNIVNGNFNKAYQLLDIEESDFINADSFENYCCLFDFSQVTNYSVTAEIADSSLGGGVYINYRNKGDVEDSYYRLNLYKTGSGDWAIGYSSMVIPDYEIIVSKGATVQLDGVELTDDLKMSGSEEYDEYDMYDTYIIPELFAGMHVIKVSLGDASVLTTEFNTDIFPGVYECTTMNYSEEALNDLQELAANNMKTIYSAAVNGKAFEEVASLMCTNENILENIKYDYEYLVDYFHDANYLIKDLKITNIQTVSESEYAYVSVTFNYQVDYQGKDWWTGEWEAETYKSSENSEISFVYENGKFVQTNLGCPSLYY